MIKKPTRNSGRKKRHGRVRNDLFGTQERPRLNVFRSNKNIYAQLIDDTNGTTVASASTTDEALGLAAKGNIEAAKQVGELIAKRAQDKGYKTVVFDRGGYIFHGRVKALADAARAAGLEF
jgi:large subunit ribosomal protein L18